MQRGLAKRPENVASTRCTIVAPIGIGTKFEEISVVLKRSHGIATDTHTRFAGLGVSFPFKVGSPCRELRLAFS